MFPLLLLLACRPAPDDDPDRRSVRTDTATVDASAENILIVLVDDLGLDHVAAYGLAEDPPPTPTLDTLAREGVLFRSAYASPMCSPTRANVMTGRHARRTGVGHLVGPHVGFELDRAEIGLGELVRYGPHPYATAMVGKWHLAPAAFDDVATHPASMGFDTFAGSLENLVVSHAPVDDKSYWRWEKNVDGELVVTDAYATTDTTDDALARVAELPEPWLLYVAYNAAHMPWHAPPAALHDRPVTDASTNAEKYDAMVQSVDRELGRLLDGLAPELRARTTVIVMGDNGTPDHVITAPFEVERSKGSLYEGGVRVPLIVTGPHVLRPGSETGALVHAVDVFATVADLAGVPLTGPDAPPFLGPIDGASLVPWLADPDRPSRELVFAEKFQPVGFGPYDGDHRMIRDAEWKLARIDQEGEAYEALFHAEPGAFDEGPDLLADGAEALDPDAAAAYDRLSEALDAKLAELRPTDR